MTKVQKTLIPSAALAIAEGTTPATKSARRPPRRLGDGPLIKIRITADSEAEAIAAVALVEQQLAKLNCRMQRPRVGSNPKYADDPKWLAYGDFEITGAQTTRLRRKA